MRLKLGKDVEDYTHECYRVQNYLAAYSVLIRAMPPLADWPVLPPSQRMLPPLLRSAGAGRIHIERMRAGETNKRTVRCRNCGSLGHNKRACPKLIDRDGSDGEDDGDASDLDIAEPPPSEELEGSDEDAEGETCPPEFAAYLKRQDKLDEQQRTRLLEAIDMEVALSRAKRDALDKDKSYDDIEEVPVVSSSASRVLTDLDEEDTSRAPSESLLQRLTAPPSPAPPSRKRKIPSQEKGTTAHREEPLPKSTRRQPVRRNMSGKSSGSTAPPAPPAGMLRGMSVDGSSFDQ
jgi:hypothetical protein